MNQKSKTLFSNKYKVTSPRRIPLFPFQTHSSLFTTDSADHTRHVLKPERHRHSVLPLLAEAARRSAQAGQERAQQKQGNHEPQNHALRRQHQHGVDAPR